MSSSGDVKPKTVALEITENIINDYYTAEVRCEVIIDTLLTPVIADVVKNLTGYEKVGFLAKEFPLMKADIASGDGKTDRNCERDESSESRSLRSVNADYILRGEDKNGNQKIIIVELKTDQGSISHHQLDNYIQLLENKQINLLNGFKRILVKYSDCGYSSPGDRDLKSIFMDVVYRNSGKSGKTYPEIDSSDYVDVARSYLQKRKKNGRRDSSSKKYILQAGQILKGCKDPESLFGDKMTTVELFYLLPDEDSVASFRSMINKKKIGETVKSRIGCGSLSDYIADDRVSNASASYKDWLIKDVLAQLFAYGDDQ